ncbi:MULTISPECIES: CPBP family intramembrane glutamic endopeptidase [Lactobacillus]|uniref:CPBP family intramembrane metalloprotease n=1 Tax=Lactobacillus xujianguonis TaxID=2495899 RepID=A0A437SVY1_9LACO|nr:MULTISPECIES: CPBP family intramembrane glutamic endopeptidase [Lactobacillus]RVU71086.1 CPBP family intramembrane metalloprotease [Lactobacillus xujianguonis]RVU76758.1 CPBP family intramembrane metalloprotease [Lactobacillus xujianguonis]
MKTNLRKQWKSLLIILVATIAINLFVSACFTHLIKSFPTFAPGWFIIYFICSFFALWPIIINQAPKIHNNLMRIILVIILEFVFLNFSLRVPFTKFAIFSAIDQSSILNAISFFFIGLFLLKAWGFNEKKMFSFSFSKFPHKVMLVFLLIIAIWIVISANLITCSSTIADNFINWTSLRDLTNLPPLENSLTALMAGILEETVRYLLLTLFLAIFVNQKIPQTKAAVMAALIFSLSHWINLLTTNQGLAATLVQVITSFFFGLLLCSLQLYTETIWFAVVIHAGFDSLNFWISANPLIKLTTPWWLTYDPTGNYVEIVIMSLLYLIIPVVIVLAKKLTKRSA